MANETADKAAAPKPCIKRTTINNLGETNGYDIEARINKRYPQAWLFSFPFYLQGPQTQAWRESQRNHILLLKRQSSLTQCLLSPHKMEGLQQRYALRKM